MGNKMHSEKITPKDIKKAISHILKETMINKEWNPNTQQWNDPEHGWDPAKHHGMTRAQVEAKKAMHRKNYEDLMAKRYAAGDSGEEAEKYYNEAVKELDEHRKYNEQLRRHDQTDKPNIQSLQ